MTSVFILSTGQDTAGQGYRVKAAFDRHAPGWSVRSMRVSPGPFAYPNDLSWNDDLARALWASADVTHIRNTLHGWERFDRGQGKPLVLHHHGSHFRLNHWLLAAKARAIGAVQVASTLDLTLLEPGIEWIPAPYDLEELAVIRRAHYVESDVVRIAHAPTNRAVKSTAAVIAAVEELRSRGLPVELDLIEDRPWAECLERKARADIYVDQVILGYGCNSIESWGMGIPVVANAEDPATLEVMRQRFGELPFFRATEANMTDRLAELVTKRQLRAEYAARGRAHVVRFHDGRRVVDLLRDIYRSAGPTGARKASAALATAGAQA